MPEESEKLEIDELQNLNPQVTTVNIGVRSLRKITLYPLSVGDQLKMTNIIATKIVGFLSTKEGGDDAAMAGFFINMINENISKFLALATCEKPNDKDKYPQAEKLLDDITNLLVSNIALEIYRVIFEESSKNFGDLFKKVKGLFQLERSLPQSVKDTITDLKTFSEKPLKKEE